ADRRCCPPRRRGRTAVLGCARASPQGLQPAVRGDGPRRRGGRCARGLPHASRRSAREGRGPEAAGPRRDDLSRARHHIRGDRSAGTGGVPILQAIEITGKTAGIAVIERSMGEVIASVKAGGTIAEPLKHARSFPPMVSQMVGVGEETGALDAMLTKIADFYDDEVAAAVKALTSIMEPVMIIVVGGIVGVIVISMYLPLFSIYNSIR